MEISDLLKNLDLTKDYDAVQKGVNCAILTYLLYTNINILKNIIDTKFNDFNKYTMMYFAEFKGSTVKLLSRDLNHEIILNTHQDPLVILMNFCISLYGQLSVATEIYSYAKDYFFKIARANTTLSNMLF